MADRRAIVIPEDLSDALLGESTVKLGVITYSPYTTPGIITISVPLKSTETFVALALGVQQFTIKLRSSFQFRLGFSAGSTTTTWITVDRCYESPQYDDTTPITLYFSTIRDAEVVEILTWA